MQQEWGLSRIWRINGAGGTIGDYCVTISLKNSRGWFVRQVHMVLRHQSCTADAKRRGGKWRVTDREVGRPLAIFVASTQMRCRSYS